MTWLATGKAPWKSDRPSFGCSSDLYMKTSPALLAALLLSSTIALGAPSTNDLAGNWQGALEVGQAKLLLLFKISRTPAGVLTAKLDSLDQGARDIPVKTIVTKDLTVRMEEIGRASC